MKNGIYKPRDAYCDDDDGIACLRMYNIDAGQIVWKDIKRMRLSEDEKRDYGLLPGDLLVNRVNSRELVGKAAPIRRGLEACVFESKNIRVRLKRELADPQFVGFALQANGQSYFNRNAQQVVGMASISQPQVAAFPLPLPPLEKQQQIVAEIEKQFTRLEAGVAALRRVQANLKRYRAAVLKAACEGKLVPTEAALQKSAGKGQKGFESGEQLLKRILAERRQNWTGRGKYKEPVDPDTTNLSPLPAGWTWASVGQLLREPLCNGVSVKGSDNPPGVRALRLSAMSDSGFDYSKSRYLPVAESNVDDLWIREGDFFMSRGNGSLHLVGRGTSAQKPPQATIFPDTMIRLRLADPPRVSGWIRTLWPSRIIRLQIEAQVKTTAGIYKIAQPQVARMVVPLPPLLEQARIVAEVERRFSVVEELEATVSASLLRATRLRQAVLRKGFTGNV